MKRPQQRDLRSGVQLTPPALAVLPSDAPVRRKCAGTPDSPAASGGPFLLGAAGPMDLPDAPARPGKVACGKLKVNPIQRDAGLGHHRRWADHLDSKRPRPAAGDGPVLHRTATPGTSGHRTKARRHLPPRERRRRADTPGGGGRYPRSAVRRAALDSTSGVEAMLSAQRGSAPRSRSRAPRGSARANAPGSESRSSGCWRGRGGRPAWAASLRAILARPDGALDVSATIGALGREAVVRAAKQAHIFRQRTAALAGGMMVVEFQPSGAAAALTSRVDPAAAESVTLQYHTSSRACDTRGGGCGRGGRIAL